MCKAPLITTLACQTCRTSYGAGGCRVRTQISPLRASLNIDIHVARSSATQMLVSSHLISTEFSVPCLLSECVSHMATEQYPYAVSKHISFYLKPLILDYLDNHPGSSHLRLTHWVHRQADIALLGCRTEMT